MPPSPSLFTSDRLGFRNWTADDLDALATLNADAEVMEYFPRTQSREESAAFIQRMQAHFEEYGHTFFAAEERATGEVIGFIGFIYQTKLKLDFTPCPEIGWRLKKSAWGKGYATEGAARCLDYAKNEMGYTEMYSFTAALNVRSERVMRKIGMERKGTFEHPALEEGSALREHVLYWKRL